MSKRSVRLQRSFPLTAVIGQDHIKQALLLGACDTGGSIGPFTWHDEWPNTLFGKLHQVMEFLAPVLNTVCLMAGLGGVCIAGKRGTCKVRACSHSQRCHEDYLWVRQCLLRAFALRFLVHGRSLCLREGYTLCCPP